MTLDPTNSRRTSGRSGATGRGSRPRGVAAAMDATRPRATEGEQLLLRILGETHTVQTRDGPASLTLREALLRKSVETAMKGSPMAQRDLFDRDARASAAEAARIDEECAVWSAFRKRQQILLDKASANGAPAAAVLPHPDNIEIIPDRGVRLRGPFDAGELARWNGALALREALLFQDALEYRLNGCMDDPPAAGSPLVFALFIDAGLPPSLRIPEAARLFRVMQLRSLTKRDLLRDTHQAWQRAGVPLPRGRRFLSPALMAESFDILSTGVHDMAASASAAAQDHIAAEVLAALADCRREGEALMQAEAATSL